MNSFSITAHVMSSNQKELSSTKLQELEVEDVRSYKNSNGEYDRDIFQLELWNTLAELKFEKGDLISARGHVKSNNYLKDGSILYRPEFIVEKIAIVS